VKFKACKCGNNTGGGNKPTNLRSKAWFNHECSRLYREYKQALTGFNRNKTNAKRVKLADYKRAYKTYAARTKRNCLRQEGNMLDTLKRGNPKQFYKHFKKKRKRTNCAVSVDGFRNFFHDLYSDNVPRDNRNTVNADCVFEELDAPFSYDVVLADIHKLKRDRAPGIDGLVNEIFIECSDLLVPILTDLFNHILESGTYPASWNMG
jgi:hypothetical protein